MSLLELGSIMTTQWYDEKPMISFIVPLFIYLSINWFIYFIPFTPNRSTKFLETTMKVKKTTNFYLFFKNRKADNFYTCVFSGCFRQCWQVDSISVSSQFDQKRNSSMASMGHQFVPNYDSCAHDSHNCAAWKCHQVSTWHCWFVCFSHTAVVLLPAERTNLWIHRLSW